MIPSAMAWFDDEPIDQGDVEGLLGDRHRLGETAAEHEDPGMVGEGRSRPGFRRGFARDESARLLHGGCRCSPVARLPEIPALSLE